MVGLFANQPDAVAVVARRRNQTTMATVLLSLDGNWSFLSRQSRELNDTPQHLFHRLSCGTTTQTMVEGMAATVETENAAVHAHDLGVLVGCRKNKRFLMTTKFVLQSMLLPVALTKQQSSLYGKYAN